MNFVLDKHRFFPAIAWMLVIGFVVFTYTLTIQLTQATNTTHLEAAAESVSGN